MHLNTQIDVSRISNVTRQFDFDGNETSFTVDIDGITTIVTTGTETHQAILAWAAVDGNNIVDSDVPTP